MIRLKPEFELHFSCPECGSGSAKLNCIGLPGMYWLADYRCDSCGTEFLQSLPVGHMIDHPLGVNKKSGKLYPDDWNMWWQYVPFSKSFATVSEDDVPIRKVVYKESKKVLILNTLDYLYGHTILRLFNAQHYLDHHPDVGLIVIVPQICEWLIPEGCAEAWIVPLRLGQMVCSYPAIDRFVSDQLERFDEVYISKGFNHPDFTKIDISRFTGVRPFDVEKFYDQKPFFTFALREDRWWLRSPINSMVFRVARKLGLSKFLQSILVKQQNALVRRAIRRIRREIPEAEFGITGLGKGGSLSRWASDRRAVKITPEIEREWCRMYAQSHVVIGIHGSNMLLPTAHAAGCVEVLMQDRYRNIVQDLSVRYNDRRQLFFYRFVDQYAAPSSVAAKVVAIYRNYENCYRNFVLNQH
ncbi:MAG TPA: hypothetical protein VKZ75_02580 [Cyclobacteriaceae bacterium]|nr:hypothetical protein [Cyclobacteriaceae bacterium]